MNCVQHCYGSRRRRAERETMTEAALAEAPQRAASGLPSVISGTWDFKWPIGTQIRVAFQRLAEDVRGLDYELEKRLVVQHLDAWFSGDANLSFAVVGDLPAPPAKKGDRRPSKSAPGTIVPYDVLVSFSPLPIVLPETELVPLETPVGTSASELGRYAQRSEYGVPTMFLGPQPGFTVAQWLASPERVFTVAHELGHVLGLPHEQQNPHARLDWKPMEEMIAIVKGRKGLPAGMTEREIRDFINDEIVLTWPGEERFSDWRKPAAVHPGASSVMAKPSYRCLLKGVHDASCTPEGCDTYTADLAALTGPTPSDLAHLRAMYGPKPDADVSEEAPVSSAKSAAQ